MRCHHNGSLEEPFRVPNISYPVGMESHTHCKGIISIHVVRLISHCIAGTLQAVDSLIIIVEELNISWRAPFSLRADLITYCVEVTDSDSSDKVLSLCGITNTTLRIPSPSP
jgi:hypothetical protein